MNEYLLTDDQKNRLRALVPGLKQGLVDTKWSVFSDRDTIKQIDGLGNRELWTNVWKGVTWADFDDFVENGFFREKGKGSYTLNRQLLIHACENDFKLSELPPPYNTFNILNSAGTVNVQSTLEDVTQTIHNSPANDGNNKQKLNYLVEQLKQHLETTPIEYRLDLKAIETIVQLINSSIAE